jgi:hypothetical protein
MHFPYDSSLDRNRTCIWGFGNPYTIHCTTRPKNILSCLELRPQHRWGLYYPRPTAFGRAGIVLRGQKLFYQPAGIGGKYFYRNGQQNYAEKFSYHSHSVWSNGFFYPF